MKILFKSLLLVCGMIITFTGVNATARDDLISYLNQNHVIYGNTIAITAYQRTQVERYLNSHTVTDSQVAVFKSKVEEIKSVMNNAQVVDPNKLTTSDKNKVINLAKDAGIAVGITVTINSTNNRVELYNNSGALLDVFSLSTGKLPFTGTSSLICVITVVISTTIAMLYIFEKGTLNHGK